MKQEKIQSVRYILVQKLEDLFSIAENSISNMKNADGQFADPFDQAAMETNKFVELACREVYLAYATIAAEPSPKKGFCWPR
jgi:RNA polymerase-binding transcription factor DksA